MQSTTSHTIRNFSCKEISYQQLDLFSSNHPQGNFQQSAAMASVRKQNGASVIPLGFFENDDIIGACILEIHGSGIGCFAEIHDGPLLDYHDKDVVAFAFSELRKYAKDKGAVQLVITPEIVWQVRNLYGETLTSENALKDGIPAEVSSDKDELALNNLLDCGFIHEGFTTGYAAVPRWRFIKELAGVTNSNDLLNSFPTSTKRNNIRIALDSGIVVRKISRDDLSEFHKLCEMSSEKQGFDNRDLAFYELLYDNFGESAEFDIAYIDTAKQISTWQTKAEKFESEVRKFEEQLASANNKKRVENRIVDSKEKLKGALRRVDKAKEYAELGSFIPVACAMFIWHERECVYLYSGSNPEYNNLYGSNAIQFYAMDECIKRGCRRYNFYGINGIFDDKNDPGRGVLEFKQGFGGYVEEMLGYFEMPLRPAMYRIKKLAHKVLGR